MSGEITKLVEMLVAAGAKPKVILAAVREAEQQKDALAEDGREKARARWRKWKASNPDANAGKRLQTLANVDKRLVRERARVEDISSNLEIAGQKENKKEAAPSARQPRGSRIPDDFQPDIGAAVAEGVSRQDAEREAQSFVDYWRAKAGREAVKLDWPATWRVWYRRNLGRKSATAPPRRDTYVDAMNRILEGRANGTENLFGTDGDAQRLPADGKRQGIDVADVRGGLARRFIQGSH